MEPTEYLAFLPLLFYGIALAELIGQWRRYFDRAQLYLPYFITTIVFTEAAIWNVYRYLEVVSNLEGVRYYQYLLFLVQPMVFLLMVSALTPEPDNPDTEGYFKQRISVVFGLMAAFILSHLFAGLGATVSVDIPRFAAIALCMAIAITRKIWLVYVMAALWPVSLYTRL